MLNEKQLASQSIDIPARPATEIVEEIKVLGVRDHDNQLNPEKRYLALLMVE